MQLEPTILKSNKQDYLVYSKNLEYHARTKHIDIQHHFIREKIKMEIINMIYCETKDLIVNLYLNRQNNLI